MKHTKGQWRIKESGRCVCSPSKTICNLIGIDDGALSITPEVEANARLIASAPAMLKELVDTYNMLDRMRDADIDGRDYDRITNRMISIHERIEKLI